MVKIMSYNDSYYDICKNIEYEIVVYGAGLYAQKAIPYINNIS